MSATHPEAVLAAGSFSKAVAITKADSDLDAIPDALYVGSTGNLSLMLADDTSEVSFVGVPAGTVLRVRAKQVRDTGSTADDIVGLFV